MSKEVLCFKIEGKELYLEQILVDFNDVAIFFLCKNEVQYYIALCADYHESTYIVAKVTIEDIYKLLHSELTMRDFILKQKEYYQVYSGFTIDRDKIEKHKMEDIDESVLPENEYFKVLTERIEGYVRMIDEIYNK
jgi:hypothetical protein